MLKLNEPLVNSNKAAQLLGISRRTLDRKIREGSVNPIMIGRTMRFPGSLDLLLSLCVKSQEKAN